MQAPSPMTNPARVASNGREASVGSSSSATSPRIAQNPARISGVIGASVPPASDDVGLAAPDRRRRLADRGRAGRARGDGREVLSLEAELDRDLPARRVDEHRGDEEGRDAIRPALGEDLLLLDDRRDPADRRPDEDPDARGIDAVQPRIVPRLLRGGDGEEDVAVHPSRLLRRHELAGVEAAHLRGDPHRVLGGVERLDPPDAAATRYRGIPGRCGIEADRRDRPEAGDDDAPHDPRRLLGTVSDFSPTPTGADALPPQRCPTRSRTPGSGT